MKIKDLPRSTQLFGLKFKYKGEEYYWYSQWESGIWAKKDWESEEVFPIYLEDLVEALDFEVVENSKHK